MSGESAPGVIVKAENKHVGGLEAGESYYATVTVTLPFELEGAMHVITMADSELTESGSAQSSLSSRLKGVRGSLAGKVREFEGEGRSEEHTSELQSLMRTYYPVFCLKKKNTKTQNKISTHIAT